MILPSKGDIIESIPKGRELVVMEDWVGEEKPLEEENTHTTWEESCLPRFSKFLGMSQTKYEDEVLALMHKISGRRLDERGKEVQRTTKFVREMKKLQWTVQEKERSTKESVGRGTRAITVRYK